MAITLAGSGSDSGADSGLSVSGATDSNPAGNVNPATRIPPFTNPRLGPFNSHNYAGPASIGGPLFRGWMLEDQDGIDVSQRYRLNFHYNPQAIVLAYDISNSTISPDVTLQAAKAPNQLLGTTVSFDLVFDRSYQPNARGVMDDVRILDKIITGGIGGPGRQSSVGGFGLVRIAFGRTPAPGTVDLPRGYLANPLGFRGYITGCNVQYNRFNRDMVPTQGVASITVLASFSYQNSTIAGGGQTGSLGTADSRIAGTQPQGPR